LDIAREAGLSKGGVYFHYRAKEALFHDILDNQLKTLEARWSFEPVADQRASSVLSWLSRMS
jgi:AcrR family transcriptional regulator